MLPQRRLLELCLLCLSYLPRSKLRYVDLSLRGDRYNFDLKQFDIFSIILLMDVYTPLSSIAGEQGGKSRDFSVVDACLCCFDRVYLH